MEARCRITSGEGNLRESATESKPPRKGPRTPGARVKGCGKSAPRTQQCGRQGKPHREQDRIGTTGVRARPVSRLGRPGWLLEAVSNDRPRGMVATSGVASPGPYKTRLTGRLTTSFLNLRPKTEFNRKCRANRWPAYGSLTLKDSDGGCLSRSIRSAQLR